MKKIILLSCLYAHSGTVDLKSRDDEEMEQILIARYSKFNLVKNNKTLYLFYIGYGCIIITALVNYYLYATKIDRQEWKMDKATMFKILFNLQFAYTILYVLNGLRNIATEFYVNNNNNYLYLLYNTLIPIIFVGISIFSIVFYEENDLFNPQHKIMRPVSNTSKEVIDAMRAELNSQVKVKYIWILWMANHLSIIVLNVCKLLLLQKPLNGNSGQRIEAYL